LIVSAAYPAAPVDTQPDPGDRFAGSRPRVRLVAARRSAPMAALRSAAMTCGRRARPAAFRR